MWLGFPPQVWVILGVEFAERMGYYAVAFSLYTYCIHMLSTGAAAANAIINGIYIIVPLCACLSSGLADGPLGRANVLGSSLGVYGLGLVLLTISSLPFMFSNFPYGPSGLNITLFAISLVLFGAGYGGMKVCTNPMMADSITAMHTSNEQAPLQDEPLNDMEKVRVQEGITDDLGDIPNAQLDLALQSLFRVAYCVSNCGALVGIFLAPLLRNLDTRVVEGASTSYTSGYYYSYCLAAVAVLAGAIIFFRHFALFPVNEKTPPFVFFRLFGRALFYRICFAVGSIKNAQFELSNVNGFLGYALYGKEASLPTEDVTGYHSVEERGTLTSDGENIYTAHNLNDCQRTLGVCVSFIALPLYWLICNQFSTNIMFQAESLHLPTWVPPEMFNNINTFTVLIFLAVCERTSRRSQSLGISAHTRVAAGFVLMSFTMVWCGVVQTVVTGRGFYNDNEEYVLKEGKEKLSSAVLIVPYVVQGIAAGLVDPSVMEIAYVGAPAQMKGTVMGLYWLASSCSGFLGVVFSPIMHPSNATWLFFTFGLCQLCVTGVFYYFNASKTRSIGG